MKKYYILDAITIRRISLLCVIIQSIGIRFFSGIGFLLTFIILLINYHNYRKIRVSHPTLLCLIVSAIIGICVFKGFTVSSIMYLIVTLLAAVSVILNYNENSEDFIKDIYPILWFLSIYGLISWSVFMLIPSLFQTVEWGLKYSTLYYLLINISSAQGSLPRLSSLLWEPGCCQFILNFLLIILVTCREKKYKIILVALLILATRSTTGYINLILVMILYARVNKINIIKIILVGSFVFGLGLYSIVSDNINDKVANTSGIIRVRDFYVGYELTKRHPIKGVDTANLDINPEAQVLEDEIWGINSPWTLTQGYFAGGYTNGLMGVFLDYGVILGLILYWYTLRSPLIWNNKNKITPWCFYAVYFCSLTGEPIARTSLFFFFALSYLVLGKRKAKFPDNLKYNFSNKKLTSEKG